MFTKPNMLYSLVRASNAMNTVENEKFAHINRGAKLSLTAFFRDNVVLFESLTSQGRQYHYLSYVNLTVSSNVKIAGYIN